eukprot:m.218472 g.218472  ORF g.218472 m.218472 type:complete len:95 (-) comp18683_c0_seq4:875-1159(-)
MYTSGSNLLSSPLAESTMRLAVCGDTLVVYLHGSVMYDDTKQNKSSQRTLQNPKKKDKKKNHVAAASFFLWWLLTCFVCLFLFFVQSVWERCHL